MSKKSKFIARVLRHEPGLIGLDIDRNGWVRIDHFISQCGEYGVPFKSSGKPYSYQEVIDIILADNKGRFALSEDRKRMRAVHGHSIEVDIGSEREAPPEVLYHGTTGKSLEAIFEIGIVPMKRQYVHLSETVDQAINVGSRHGAPVILEVEAKRLHEEGKSFFRSESGVWLTDEVAPGYFHISGFSPPQIKPM
ncbi:RNA 2'-phosphotransferase [Sulfitobacter sp. R18_1]|uniref:RNA 2'-phosphotransferase n=1 Tax=Sulfitobacter sp. R18_1 TaxID=2821104 RepID=UPI001ADA680C|nr:RNA 2'-phosphotransferase [Sulfitobacter sp. R18_1]MBO9428337.1 RNA 2'-phosphotransferase [Sulfitobacter sp. R18_1]